MITIKAWLIPVTLLLCTLMVSGAAQVHAQESSVIPLSDGEKSAFVESVLREELKLQIAEFNGIITNVSSEHIEFIEPSQISRLGFTLISPTALREREANGVIAYVVFKGIDVKGKNATVNLSRVVEGHPCYGPRFSREQNYIYQYDSESGRWIRDEIRKQPRRPGPLRESTRWSRAAGAPIRIHGAP